jgi:SAM-dependent methyltransferase
MSNNNLTEKETMEHWWDGDPNGFYEFMGYKIPVSLIMKTGAGPTVFEQIALGHRMALEKWIGIESRHNIVEIGCGIGRDAMWLSRVLSDGRYTGIDIIPESIDWCRNNISKNYANFSFHHFDVEDSLHNPAGKSDVNIFRFPNEDNSIDRIFAFSVFTHMYADQIAHYLKECSRVLRPGGKAYLTIFLYNDQILQSAARHANTPFDLRFETEIEPGCRVNNPAEPLGAISFTWDRVEKIIKAAGLQLLRAPLNGAWSGFYETADDGQDVLLLQK